MMNDVPPFFRRSFNIPGFLATVLHLCLKSKLKEDILHNNFSRMCGLLRSVLRLASLGVRFAELVPLRNTHCGRFQSSNNTVYDVQGSFVRL